MEYYPARLALSTFSIFLVSELANRCSGAAVIPTLDSYLRCGYRNAPDLF